MTEILSKHDGFIRNKTRNIAEKIILRIIPFIKLVVDRFTLAVGLLFQVAVLGRHQYFLSVKVFKRSQSR